MPNPFEKWGVIYMSSTEQLEIYEILKINELFDSQGWPKDEKNKSSLYKRYLNRYMKLDPAERQLFIKLSNQYKWVSADEYLTSAVQLLENVVRKHCTNAGQAVWIYPIKKNEDQRHIKSSDVVSYLCKSLPIQYSAILYKRKIHIISTLDDLIQKKDKIQKSVLFLVDDFIGSGNYASSVVDELISNGIPEDKMVVCSLYISEMGLKMLQTRKCSLEFLNVAPSCISELSTSEQELILQMESSLNVDDEFSLGYGQSANLISLLRTPNNSLPVFWLDKGRTHSAPFPR